MSFVDRAGRLQGFTRETPGALELGCGPSKVDPTAVGVDMLDHPAVDVVGEAVEVLTSLPEGSVARVHSAHFFEHVPDLDGLMAALSRAVADGGVVTVTVPHFANPYYHSDPTHVRPFGLYSFSYLAAAPLLHRQVPRYGKDYRFEVTSLHLGFTSPWYLRRMLRKVVEVFANLSNSTREFYEENLVYVVPPYELTATLRRLPR